MRLNSYLGRSIQILKYRIPIPFTKIDEETSFPGMHWSVSPGIGGQLAPECGGQVQQNLHVVPTILISLSERSLINNIRPGEFPARMLILLCKLL
jgi:hypothetical protein